MPPKEVISPRNAPKAIGPYSAGIRVGEMIFTAGQLGVDPASGEFVQGGVGAETRQALKNLTAVLAESGASLEDVVKTTVFLRDMDDFSLMNGVYAQFFKEDPPARSAVQVARLPKDAAVEIEAIAVID